MSNVNGHMMDPQTTAIINILNSPGYAAAFLAFGVWSLVWKGFALWKAAGNKQKKWFIAMLLINSLGILEIVYIFYFGKPKSTELPK